MHVIFNGKVAGLFTAKWPEEELDCFKYQESQVAADGGCKMDVVHIMNRGYGAWGALQSVLGNGGLEIKAKMCLYEGIIVPTALY